MGTRVYLTNLASDVSGYKLALIGTPNPNPPSALVTAVTATTSGGSSIPMTLTSGGTAAKWITKPLLTGLTIAGKIFANIWAYESNAAANATLELQIAPYTTSQQSAILDDLTYTTELTTSAALVQWVTAAVTSTAFAVGDRIVITPYIDNVGTMGASQTVTMDYDIPTPNTDGNTYVEFSEQLDFSETQFGDGTMIHLPGQSTGHYADIMREINAMITGKVISQYSTVNAALLELGYERDKQ